MQINIHWGEFCGPVNRTEVEMTAITKQIKNPGKLYKYEIDLKGYLPFALFYVAMQMASGSWLHFVFYRVLVVAPSYQLHSPFCLTHLNQKIGPSRLVYLVWD